MDNSLRTWHSVDAYVGGFDSTDSASPLALGVLHIKVYTSIMLRNSILAISVIPHTVIILLSVGSEPPCQQTQQSRRAF